jgi:cysteine desulfurase / selenocysteine lyase
MKRHLGITIILHYIDSKGTGDFPLDQLRQLVTERTKVIVLTHVHHVFGVETSVRKVRQLVGPLPRIVLDASQSIGHIPVNVSELGIDFLVFSGHKLFSDTGIGVLWIKHDLHDLIHPVFVGGDIDGRKLERAEMRIRNTGH